MGHVPGLPVFYAMNIQSLPSDESALQALIETMPPERKKRLRAFSHKDSRKRSLAAGLLLREGLGEDAVLHIQTEDDGKPFIPGGPHFSVSHSKDWALLAICNAPCGVDIQYHKKINAETMQSLASRAFHPLEQATLTNSFALQNYADFFALWAAKESYIKMTGKGFACALNSFCVTRSGDSGGIDAAPEACIYFFDGIIKDYSIAFCSAPVQP